MGQAPRDSWFRRTATARRSSWSSTKFEEEFKALRKRGISQTSAARVAAEKAAKT